MIIQGANPLAARYGSLEPSPAIREKIPAIAANDADRVSISDTARALLYQSQTIDAEDSEVRRRLAEIKSRPGVERSEADFAYLSKHDKRFIELQEKMKASGLDGFDALTADEVDYMQKAGGFVNTMACLSPCEKALYDEIVAKGDRDTAHGLLLVAMSRIGMSGQQVQLPNGKSFDPTNTEVTAKNIRNLFKFMFVDSSGSTDRQFEALAAYLDRREGSSAPIDPEARRRVEPIRSQGKGSG